MNIVFWGIGHKGNTSPSPRFFRSAHTGSVAVWQHCDCSSGLWSAAAQTRSRRGSELNRGAGCVLRQDSDAAIEPVHFVRKIRIALRAQVIAQLARTAVGVDDIAEHPRGDLYPRGAVEALPLVGDKCTVEIGGPGTDFRAEHHSVLYCHA